MATMRSQTPARKTELRFKFGVWHPEFGVLLSGNSKPQTRNSELPRLTLPLRFACRAVAARGQAQHALEVELAAEFSAHAVVHAVRPVRRAQAKAEDPPALRVERKRPRQVPRHRGPHGH